MTVDANIAATRRFISEGFTQGRLEICDELVAPDMVEHQRGLAPGPEGAKETIRTLHSWFSDFELHIDDLAAAQDTVWIRCTGSGVNTGYVFGHEPTGRQMSISVFDVLRWRDGQLVEHWGVPDQLGLLVQLGIFDPRAQRSSVAAP
jgi:predicted ester cyclase